LIEQYLVTSDPHQPLREDVRLLGELLGDTIRTQAGEPLFHTVERVRALAKSARAGNDTNFRTLSDELSRTRPARSKPGWWRGVRRCPNGARAWIDLIEMVLAKADGRIAGEYDRRLVPAPLQPFGAELRDRLVRAIRGVLDLTGHRELLQATPVIRRSIDVRNPYVDPINLVQIALLAHLRGDTVVTDDLWQAFLITVNGIAAGMRNVG
jgi:phosphoenolpyruvate carboxylase